MLNVGECIVKIKNRIEPCLVKTPLVPIIKGLVNDKWLKTHYLNTIFSKQFFNGKIGRSVFYSLKKNINDILAGKKVPPGIIKKENTHFKSGGNTQGNCQNQIRGNTPVSSRDSENIFSKSSHLSTANIKGENPKPPMKISPQHKLLIDIFKNPFSSTIERYKRLSMHTKSGNLNRKLLISKNASSQEK